MFIKFLLKLNAKDFWWQTPPIEHTVRVHTFVHWCQLNVKASLEQAFRYCLVPSLRLEMPLIEAPPSELAAEPPRAAFPASGWKRGFKGVSAEVDTNDICASLLITVLY
ncbi:hypothetical protein [Nostoc sp. ChiQUE01b]|uniref:hypothetical protein n=1 Tax=Nostoc sp. ChiQUE01b TaxID=3075376 RepID=UPI002AD4FE0D|nr:hypothetical protein [Nostoc sp. ChiQUE01b]MDZ8258854.1 hypothetical protein [Nostoc sp. ChiQUE01b]